MRAARPTTGPRSRFKEAGGRLLMPVAVDVHHALCDGVHVGRFFERLQDQLNRV